MTPSLPGEVDGQLTAHSQGRLNPWAAIQKQLRSKPQVALR